MDNKINSVFLLVVVLLFCWVGKVYSKDSEEVTVYVTVTANSTTEEDPTTTVEEEIEKPTIEVEDTDEYKDFVKALSQTEDDDCLYHLIIISLNFFHANEIEDSTCENRYFDALNHLRDEKPCEGKNNNQLQYIVDYMDAQIQLLCQTYDDESDLELTVTDFSTKIEKRCPLINHLKTNYTKYYDELFKECKKVGNVTDETDDPQASCITNILKNYKKMQIALNNLDDEHKEKVVYKSNNETITFKWNITSSSSLFEDLENRSKCPFYSKLTSDSVVSMTISLTAIIFFSFLFLFIHI